MKRTVNEYTVHTKEPWGVTEEGIALFSKVFTNLPEARVFAGEQYRDNNFVSLLNFKQIPLPI